jgi:RHS repeat-associated protein
MVEKNASGTYSEIEYSPIGKVAVMNGRTQLQAYVPLPGGEILSPGPDTFWHVDWLGSARLASSASQRTITFDRAFAPFGETYNTVTGGTSNPDFAGLTQDTVSGEYDAEHRQYHPGQSRWISPDPAGLNAVDASNPQSWNRYAYVLNNPLIYTDQSGLDYCQDQGGNVVPDGQGGDNSIDCTNIDGTWVEETPPANMVSVSTDVSQPPLERGYHSFFSDVVQRNWPI